MLWRGIDTALILYGDIGVGKTSLLFSPDNDLVINIAECLFAKAAVARQRCEIQIGGSVLEFNEESRTEVMRPCLESGGKQAIKVADLRKVKQVLDTIKLNSNNWVRDSDGVQALHNRGHLFVTLQLLKHNQTSTLTVVDLAGCLPNLLSAETKSLLGCDQQLQFTRMGLSQFRSLVYDLAKGEDYRAAHGKQTSKLAKALAPLIAQNTHCYLIGVLKQSTPYAEAARTLELLEKAKQISVRFKDPEMSVKELSMSRTSDDMQPSYPTRVSIRTPTPRGNSRSKATALSSSRLSDSQLAPSSSTRLNASKRTPRSRHSSSMSMRSEMTVSTTVDWMNDFDTRYSRAISKRSYNGARPLLDSGKRSDSPIKVIESEPDFEEAFSGSLIGNSLLSSIEGREVMERGSLYTTDRTLERYKNLYEKAQAHVDTMQKDIAELRLNHDTQMANREVELENLRQLNQALQLKLTQVTSANEFSGIVELYEHNIEVMKAKQAALSDQMVEVLEQLETDGVHKTLTQTLLRAQHELISKEAEVARMQGFERKWLLSRRCLDNLNKRAKEMHGLIDKQASALEDYEFELNKTKDELEALRATYRDVAVEAKVSKENLTELQGEFKAVKRIERTRSISRSPGRDRSAELIMKQLQKELLDRRQHSCMRLANDLSIEIQGLYKAIERAYKREQNMVARLGSLKLDANGP